MYIFDIDGTLSILGDRLKYLNQPKKDWEACDEDQLNIPVANICRALSRDHVIVYCTGRTESVRTKTELWLESHDLPFNNLFMRKDGDYRHDTIVKPELIQLLNLSDIHAVFEDRSSMVQCWRAMGLQCFQVAEGNF